ncbi:diguanylate cyclase/phosphodiesterase [Pseudofrankia inefficax]|uniref:Diguanylate cyclase/phosphodiesterase n=1 Tax=Pseudofrankia inefficax (strain DSM 45817 / CECT 9037 / DDB 130130 / EuI1c) TaxID=298654 RepID=E3J776_PSEI1|nr:diguanylate cyclase/phosphodiesterase [Pseudofrankia inefficax]
MGIGVPVGLLGDGRAARWFGFGVAAYALAMAVCVVVLPAAAQDVVVRYTGSVALGVSCWVCVVTARRWRGVERWWRALMAATLLGGVAVSALQLLGYPRSSRTLVEPIGLAALVVLAWLAALVGLLLYPSDPFDVAIRGRQGQRGQRLHLITTLDGLLVAGAVSLLAWILILRGAVHANTDASILLFYFATTAVGTALVVVVFLIAAFRRPRRPFGLLLLGTAQVAFTVYSLGQVRAQIEGRPEDLGVADLAVVVAPLLVAWATLLPPVTVAGRDGRVAAGQGPVLRRWWHVLLPYVPLVAASVVTLLDLDARRGLTPELWAMLGLLVLALARQLTTLTDNVRLIARVEQDQIALRHQAFHDPLTGLANRALFNDRLAQALAQRARSPTSVAVLFCDLDNFKHVNDALGHAAGDDLLCATARRLLGSVRTRDTVARLGGDEFAVLLDGQTGDPVAVGRRITDTVCRPVSLAGCDHAVRASVGLVIADRDAGPVAAETLIHRADIAMYAAKAGGTGGLTVYDPTAIAPDNTSALYAALGAALRGNPDGGELDVDYRPVVALPGGATVGQQARLTWTHPRFGTVEPSDMLPTTLADGLAPTLEQLLLSRACTHAADHCHRTGDLLPVHVPVAARLLADDTVTGEIRGALTTAQLTPRALVVELSATTRTRELRTAAPTLRHLRRLGVRISLTRLGAPDTTLDALHLLPLDLAVLDTSLTHPPSSTEEGRRADLVLTALLDLLRGLGVALAATVDNARAAHRAHQLGCAFATGPPFGDWQPDPHDTRATSRRCTETEPRRT